MAFRIVKKPGTNWTQKDESMLAVLAKGNTHLSIIGKKLGRTENAIRAKAAELGISLMPP